MSLRKVFFGVCVLSIGVTQAPSPSETWRGIEFNWLVCSVGLSQLVDPRYPTSMSVPLAHELASNYASRYPADRAAMHQQYFVLMMKLA